MTLLTLGNLKTDSVNQWLRIVSENIFHWLRQEKEHCSTQTHYSVRREGEVPPQTGCFSGLSSAIREKRPKWLHWVSLSLQERGPPPEGMCKPSDARKQQNSELCLWVWSPGSATVCCLLGQVTPLTSPFLAQRWLALLRFHKSMTVRTLAT